MMFRAALLLFFLPFSASAADVQNYYFDDNGVYVMTTEAYAEATPPPDALRISPNFVDGYWPVLNTDRTGWTFVEDHRGETGWLGDEQIKIVDLGPLPDGWANDPPPQVMTLEDAKAEKKTAIDANTTRIRDRDGLAYAGERFAMSDGAMLKWTGLMSAKDVLPYPMTILTIDDKPFLIADQTNLMQFLAAILLYETAPESPLATGRALRQQVEAAQTIEEVDAIVDDRR